MTDTDVKFFIKFLRVILLAVGAGILLIVVKIAILLGGVL